MELMLQNRYVLTGLVSLPSVIRLREGIVNFLVRDGGMLLAGRKHEVGTEQYS